MNLGKLLRQFAKNLTGDWKYTAEEIFVRRNFIAILMVGVNLVLDYVMLTTEGQIGSTGLYLGFLASNAVFLFVCLWALDWMQPEGVHILPTIICLNATAFLLHMALEIRG